MDDDEDDNQRLSPLHNKLIDKKPSSFQQDKGANAVGADDDDEEDDYYDELIKRGQKLHTNVVKKQDSKDKSDFDEDFPLGTNEDQQSSIEEKVVLKPKEI